MGTRDMDSVPPATITCAAPPRMRSAACAIACRPLAQKRFTVIAEVSTGKPARNAAMRATFMPCSASGMAQPRITSSISLGSRAGTRASASLMTSAARSSGRVVRSEPLYPRPTGVRTEETMTASAMGNLLSCGIFPIVGRHAEKSKSPNKRMVDSPEAITEIVSNCRRAPHLRRRRPGYLTGGRSFFGVGVPAGIGPLSVAADENLRDAAGGPGALSSHFGFIYVLAVGDGNIAEELHFRARKLQPQQFSTGSLKPRGGLKDARLVLPLFLAGADNDGIRRNELFESLDVIGEPGA